jgi:acetolactate synthase-1/2/3 large subunit
MDVPNNCGIPTEFEIFDEKELFIQEEYKSYPPHRPTAVDGEMLSKAADAIAKAKKPLLLVGRGAIISGAGKELYELAKKADIPIVTTPDGKTIINEEDPLWTGIVGTYGMVCANNTAIEADLIIIVGSQVSDQTTTGWTAPPRAVKTIQIDIDPREPGMKYPDSIGLCGDAKVVLQQLSSAVKAASRSEWRKEVSDKVSETLSEYKDLQLKEGGVISPERLCMEVTKALPDDAILFSDTGNSAIWSGIMIRMKDTQKYYRAAGTLGWGYPASLGGKCGAPDKPVYCFCGDGAIYFHLSEMETAVRNNINTVTIINNNGGYVQTREMLDIVYENEPIESKEKTYKFSDATDFSKVAAGFGCWSKRVTEAKDILPAIKEAAASGRPAVVEVMTSESYPPNPRSNAPRPLHGFTRFKDKAPSK